MRRIVDRPWLDEATAALQSRTAYTGLELNPYNACRFWLGDTSHDGYPVLKLRGVRHTAHRLAWQVTHEQLIPRGHLILRTCGNRTCTTPRHLSAIERREWAVRHFESLRRSEDRD